MDIWRSCQALVSIAIIAHIAQAPAPYPKRHPNIGFFDEKMYYGVRSQAIATIIFLDRYEKAWPKQPVRCHGVFVEMRKVVTACSCVAYPTIVGSESTPWRHDFDGYGLTKFEADRLMIGVLRNESRAWWINTVLGEKIELSKDCSVNYRHNMAVITTKGTPRGIKLAWVYSADWLVMKWATQKVAMGSATGAGRCEVVTWDDHDLPLKKESREEEKTRFIDNKETRIDIRRHVRVLRTHTIYLQPWHECLEQVCPRYAPEGYTKPLRFDRRECFNEYNTTRFCVSWNQMDSLCLLPEGTPVFCDVGDLHGLFGILSNATLWCGHSFNFKNVMIGIDTIMNGLYNILRIRNGPGYDDGWPEYLDVMKTPDDYKLQ